MVVDNEDVFHSPQRPPVVFRHDEHNETAEIEECNECHHVYEDGENWWKMNLPRIRVARNVMLRNGSGRKPGLKKAFHRNCKGCHLEQKKGPIMCGQCHVR